MKLRAIIDTPGIYIGYNDENQWLYVDYKGAHDPESSWAACGLMLASMQDCPCSKILNDNSNITYTTTQLSARSLEWLARVHAADPRYLV